MHRTTADGSVGNLYVDRNVSIGRAGTLLIAKDRNAIQEELCNLIEDAGITLSDADDTQLTAAVDAKIAASAASLTTLIQQKTPVGSVGIYLQSTAPAGVLYLTGATVNRGDFPDLWAWVNTNSAAVVDNANAAKFGTGDGSTTFRLPDWRGIGLRGAGVSGTYQKANGGYYDGGSLLSVLNDAMHGHRHKIGLSDNGGNTSQNVVISAAGTGWNGGPFGTDGSLYVGDPRSDGTNGPPRISSETRMVTVAIHYGVTYE